MSGRFSKNLGRYTPNLDSKGRLIFPQKVREALGDSFIAAIVMEPCVSLYTKESWDEMLEKIDSQMPMTRSRPLLRYLSSNAAEVTVDAQGRAVIPQHLREGAGLKKNVYVIGAGAGRAEIWDPDRYDELVGNMSYEYIMQELETLGL